MSRSTLVRLTALPIAIAAIAACDSSATEPTAAIARVTKPTLNIEGDTLECRNGWSILGGRYVCNGT